jgi:hypothetical protein
MLSTHGSSVRHTSILYNSKVGVLKRTTMIVRVEVFQLFCNLTSSVLKYPYVQSEPLVMSTAILLPKDRPYRWSLTLASRGFGTHRDAGPLQPYAWCRSELFPRVLGFQYQNIFENPSDIPYKQVSPSFLPRPKYSHVHRSPPSWLKLTVINLAIIWLALRYKLIRIIISPSLIKLLQRNNLISQPGLSSKSSPVQHSFFICQ